MMLGNLYLHNCLGVDLFYNSPRSPPPFGAVSGLLGVHIWFQTGSLSWCESEFDNASTLFKFNISRFYHTGFLSCSFIFGSVRPISETVLHSDMWLPMHNCFRCRTTSRLIRNCWRLLQARHACSGNMHLNRIHIASSLNAKLVVCKTKRQHWLELQTEVQYVGLCFEEGPPSRWNCLKAVFL